MTSSISQHPTIGIVIPAAGRGTRAGDGCQKGYRRIAGETVIIRVLKAFRSWNPDCPIVIVHHADDTHLLEAAIADLGAMTNTSIYTTIGGDTRQVSVLAGLRFLAALEKPPSHAFIHDAARPFVSREVLDNVRAAVVQDPSMGVSPAIPVIDTLKQTDSAGIITRTVPRDGLYRAQTPQAFALQSILSLHEQAATNGSAEYTDDASLFEQVGVAVRVVPGDPRNTKLTYQADFEEAERLLKADAKETTETTTVPDVRVGHGYDTHRLVSNRGEEILLCGVKIPHKASLLGHSDADVGLHALTNALLGTISADDIGSHFSPADPRWKDAASDRFLQHAVRLVVEAGGVLTHCDLTLVCETPKIGPHRDRMRDSVAGILGLDYRRVSIKASTNEQNGFVGREEGIVAFATATAVFRQSLE